MISTKRLLLLGIFVTIIITVVSAQHQVMDNSTYNTENKSVSVVYPMENQSYDISYSNNSTVQSETSLQLNQLSDNSFILYGFQETTDKGRTQISYTNTDGVAEISNDSEVIYTTNTEPQFILSETIQTQIQSHARQTGSVKSTYTEDTVNISPTDVWWLYELNNTSDLSIQNSSISDVSISVTVESSEETVRVTVESVEFVFESEDSNISGSFSSELSEETNRNADPDNIEPDSPEK